MTAQIREILHYKGKTYHLSTEPVNQLLELIDTEIPAFVATSTACKRGYVGTWEIVDNKLYLIDLKGQVKDVEEVTIDIIFPNQKKVFAEWFSGEIITPQGKMLHYEHIGYASIFEKDLFLEFKKCVSSGKQEVDNTKDFDPDDPMG